MAKLPTALDLSGPGSFRSGRQYFSADASAAGRGLAAFGADLSAIGAERKQQDNTVDIARAEAYKTEGLLSVQNEFDNDPDYATYGERAPKRTGEVVKKAGELIRDPQMRERWLIGAGTDAARVNDGVLDKGTLVKRSAETIAFDDALETNRRIYVDPETPEPLRKKAKADIEGAIKAGQESGLLDPVDADKRRKLFIEEAEFSRGKLAIDKDPNVIARPLPKDVSDRVGTAMGYFQSRGYSKEQAAGIVGNLMAESTLNTGANNPGDGSDGTDSVGIGQWNSGRARALKQFAAQNKADWRDFGIQLAFVDHELRTSETGAGNMLRNAKDVQSATEAMIMYERPAGSQNGAKNAHNYSGRLKFAAQAAGQDVNPDWYKNVSPENRATLNDYQERKLADFQTQQAANQKAMNGAAYDDFSLRIATGDMNLNQREILSSDIIDNGQKATLINSLNTKLKEVGETAAAVQAFAAGGLSVDPYDGKGKDAVDNVYAATTKTLAPEQVQPITEEIVRQSKTVPKQALSLIRQGLTSNDPLQIEKAAQAAQRISAIDPGALSRRDGGAEVQKVADDFSYYVNKLNMSPSDAAKRIQADNDPAKVVERKAIEPAAKQFVKSLESFDIANEFDPGLFGAQPALGTTPAQALGIQAEFIAIAEDQFFKANGDPELAKNRAVEQMKRLYGPSEFGVEGNRFNMAGQAKSVLMKHPPEMYWPKEGGSLQYARTKLWQDVTGIDPEYQEGSIQLVTTPETDAMIKRGEMPAYGILWKDKDGVMQTMPGKLWRPDLETVGNRMSKKAAEEKAVIIDRAKQTDADIKDGRDRMGSLDNFLGVTPDNFLSGGAN